MWKSACFQAQRLQKIFCCRRRVCFVFICLFWTFWQLPSPAFAQTIPHSDPGLGLVDAAELEYFLDKFFLPHMGSEIPGLAFSLVKDGELFFSKGYGYANLEKKISVDPATTLFRVGSISKLFTATAVMQLVEKGKISLEDPVESYLPNLPLSHPHYAPIKIKHLLTHTDGLDVAWSVNAATRCQRPLGSLKTFLENTLPARIFPPGQFFIYGDAGLAVAGHLVETLTGQPFSLYISQKLLEPMAMKHSSFSQPLPEHLAGQLATGYRYKNSTFEPVPFLCNKSTPTIGLSTTAQDMAQFMIAHLEGGVVGYQQILKAETLAEMQRSQFNLFPNLPQVEGSTYGFFERFQNGYRAIEHGGSMYGYINQVFLMPEQHLGFFLAYNTNNLEDTIDDTNLNIRESLIQEFLNHYYPGQEPATQIPIPESPSPIFQQYRNQLDGYYRFARYPHRSVAKLSGIIREKLPEMRVKSQADGTILISSNHTQWHEIEPFIFQYPGENTYFKFIQNDQEKIVGVALNGFASWIYKKVCWYEAKLIQQIIGCLWVSGFLGILLIWVFQKSQDTWVQRQSSSFLQTYRPASKKQGLLIIPLILFVSFANIVFVLGLALALDRIYYWEFFVQLPLIVSLLLHIPVLTTSLTGIVLILGGLAWKHSSWARLERTQFWVFIIANGFFLISLLYWNLLDYKLY